MLYICLASRVSDLGISLSASMQPRLRIDALCGGRTNATTQAFVPWIPACAGMTTPEQSWTIVWQYFSSSKPRDPRYQPSPTRCRHSRAGGNPVMNETRTGQKCQSPTHCQAGYFINFVVRVSKVLKMLRARTAKRRWHIRQYV